MQRREGCQRVLTARKGKLAAYLSEVRDLLRARPFERASAPSGPRSFSSRLQRNDEGRCQRVLTPRSSCYRSPSSSHTHTRRSLSRVCDPLCVGRVPARTSSCPPGCCRSKRRDVGRLVVRLCVRHKGRPRRLAQACAHALGEARAGRALRGRSGTACRDASRAQNSKVMRPPTAFWSCCL